MTVRGGGGSQKRLMDNGLCGGGWGGGGREGVGYKDSCGIGESGVQIETIHSGRIPQRNFPAKQNKKNIV